MDKLKAPDTLNFDATDLAHTWKKWKEKFSLYVKLVMVESDEKLKGNNAEIPYRNSW